MIFFVHSRPSLNKTAIKQHQLVQPLGQHALFRTGILICGNKQNNTLRFNEAGLGFNCVSLIDLAFSPYLF